VLAYGGLMLLLLVRLVEWPLCGQQRPVTPFCTALSAALALIILRLPLSGPRATDAEAGGHRRQPFRLAGYLRAERRADRLFRRQVRGRALADDRLAGAGDGHDVHHPQGNRGEASSWLSRRA
jgi:hypothetical protein